MSHRCRFCDAELAHSFCDLGAQPLSNAFLSAAQLEAVEPHYPLHARVCARCFLVQVPAYARPEELFSDYAYFSSYAESWMEHARSFARDAVRRFALGRRSLVVEIASNDGYLLQNFVAQDIPVLGIEPARNVAAAASEKGVKTLTRFFGRDLAREMAAAGQAADLLIGNNVLAHVPEINDFVAGLKLVLKPGGTLVMEFPHLARLIDECQFDTIYQEHFSYLSLGSAAAILEAHGITVVDVAELPTHGGSLRISARHAGEVSPAPAVRALLERETAAGLRELATYSGFMRRVQEAKRRLLARLIDIKAAGGAIAAYGAAAKGNTLLNYCGVGTDFVDYVVDRNPHKQGRYLPGSRIPVHPPERLSETRPDYLLVLPWNLKDEVMRSMAGIRAWGGKFLLPMPSAELIA